MGKFTPGGNRRHALSTEAFYDSPAQDT